MPEFDERDPYAPPGEVEGPAEPLARSYDYENEPLPRRMSSQAIGGMVAGPVLCGPVGIVLSILALRQINQNPDVLMGRGLAIGGIIVGAVATVWQTVYAIAILGA